MRIMLVHDNGEKRDVEVTDARDSVLTLRWPLAGVYELDLKRNEVSFAKKRGGRRILYGWHAENLTLAGIVYSQILYKPPPKPVSEARGDDRMAYDRLKGKGS